MSEERDTSSHEEIHPQLPLGMTASAERKAGKLGKVIVYSSAFHGSDGVDKVEGVIGEDGVSITYGEDQYHRSVTHISIRFNAHCVFFSLSMHSLALLLVTMTRCEEGGG
jgi:hypothetical protein